MEVVLPGDDDLQRFRDARAAFQKYLVAKRELLWRMSNCFKACDGLRKAVETLLRHGGVGTFRSCADERACCNAAAHGTDAFASVPGALDWMDVFFGRATEVETRVAAWSRGAGPPPKKKRRRLGGEEEPRLAEPVSSLDCVLLRDLGLHAQAFRAAARDLPFYQRAWEKREEATALGNLRIRRAALGAEERSFERNFKKAVAALSGRPLRAQDKRGAELCLSKVLPHDVALKVLSFFGANSLDYFRGQLLA